MQLRAMLGGLLVAGLVSTGCGGALPEEAPAEQGLSQTEQEVESCPAGYTRGFYWDCSRVCGSNWGNYRVFYCTNGTDYYEIGSGPLFCGACY